MIIVNIQKLEANRVPCSQTFESSRKVKHGAICSDESEILTSSSSNPFRNGDCVCTLLVQRLTLN